MRWTCSLLIGDNGIFKKFERQEIKILHKEIPVYTLTCGGPGNKRQGLGSIKKKGLDVFEERRSVSLKFLFLQIFFLLGEISSSRHEADIKRISLWCRLICNCPPRSFLGHICWCQLPERGFQARCFPGLSILGSSNRKAGECLSLHLLHWDY